MRPALHRLAPPLAGDGASPCDRYLSRRKAIFLRDWILALIALGLIVAASAFRSELGDPAPDAPRANAAPHV